MRTIADNLSSAVPMWHERLEADFGLDLGSYSSFDMIRDYNPPRYRDVSGKEVSVMDEPGRIRNVSQVRNIDCHPVIKVELQISASS